MLLGNSLRQTVYTRHASVQYVTSQLDQLSLASLQGRLIEYQHWLWGENVTSVGWQVKLCDPVWHVVSRSGWCGRLDCKLLYLYTLLYFTSGGPCKVDATTFLCCPGLDALMPSDLCYCDVYFRICL